MSQKDNYNTFLFVEALFLLFFIKLTNSLAIAIVVIQKP